jgi:murein DD-endopeptidase MepM/ murein hydrolase activator NlpD
VIARRALLAGTAAAFACSRAVFAQPSRITFSGPLEQGSLVVGKTDARASVTVDNVPVRVSPQGLFAFGFEYDQTKPAAVAAHFADGTTETQNVAPKVRMYEIQRITGLPEKYVSPPPDVLERIKREGAEIAHARSRDTAESWFADTFDWPVAGIISGTWGNQRILNGEPRAPHFGVDIAAPQGTPIHAPADGFVSLASPDFYLDGGITLLDHGHGVSTVYIHQSKLLVKANKRVSRGEVIGLVGMTGRATGPHLHWAMNWFQVKLDPSRSTRTPAPPRS